MTARNEIPEILGRTMTARWSEEPGWLIAPGAVEGIFAHRHELDMGKAHVLCIGDKRVGKFAVGEGTIRILRVADATNSSGLRRWRSVRDDLPAARAAVVLRSPAGAVGREQPTPSWAAARRRTHKGLP